MGGGRWDVECEMCEVGGGRQEVRPFSDVVVVRRLAREKFTVDFSRTRRRTRPYAKMPFFSARTPAGKDNFQIRLRIFVKLWASIVYVRFRK